MDLFLAGCQGLGLALAVGAAAGAVGRATPLATVVAALAAVLGAALFGLSLEGEDHPAWPGLPAGALAALLSWHVTSDVVAGARSRPQGSAAVGLPVLVYAAALAALSLVVSPISLAALAATVWLAIGRRRRAARKYEGLRSLR